MPAAALAGLTHVIQPRLRPLYGLRGLFKST